MRRSKYVLDHFCNDCGGYLGTTNTFEDAGSDMFNQQDKVYFRGLGLWRTTGHLKTCQIIIGLKQQMTPRLVQRLRSEDPDSVELSALYVGADVRATSLRPWRQSGMLTATRTTGEVGFRRNGSALDIWLRVNGKPMWFAVNYADLLKLLMLEDEFKLGATSDGNWEGRDIFASEPRVPVHHREQA